MYYLTCSCGGHSAPHTLTDLGVMAVSCTSCNKKFPIQSSYVIVQLRNCMVMRAGRALRSYYKHPVVNFANFSRA